MLFLLLLRDNEHCWWKSWSVITSSVIDHSHTWDCKNLQGVWGADRKIRPRYTVWRHDASPSDAKQLSRGTRQKTWRFFFLHTSWSSAFYFNVGVVINESRWRPPYWNPSCRMWRRDVVNPRRLNGRIMRPPIEPMYWQRVLLFVFSSPESVVRPSSPVGCRPTSSSTLLNLNISKVSWPILIRFYV